MRQLLPFILQFVLLLAAQSPALFKRILQIAPLLFILFLNTNKADAQYKIRGTVYDSSRNYPLEAVTVLSTSGRGTITNAYGQYEISVSEKDSIWFSYLNKPTVKFPVLKIMDPFGFDISLKVSVKELKEVKVKPRDYKEDSIQNRLDYAKAFDFQKPKLRAVTPQYGAAAGFDINEIINAFRFKRNRSMLSFQKRLITQEQEKFVDHRFSKALVRRLTKLDGNELDSFMMVFRPSYAFTLSTSEYDFQKYILNSYERFKLGLLPEPVKEEEIE